MYRKQSSLLWVSHACTQRLMSLFAPHLPTSLCFCGYVHLSASVFCLWQLHPSLRQASVQMKHRKGEENTEQEEEEHTVSVISNLFQGLSRGSRRDRVAAKFVENEFEKCDRLMELYNRYLTKVVAEQVRVLDNYSTSLIACYLAVLPQQLKDCVVSLVTCQ